MTLNEIAYNIRNLAQGGSPTDDSKLSLRQIKAWIHYHRLGLLESYTDNGRKIPIVCEQNLGSYSVFTSDGDYYYVTIKGIASFSSSSRALTYVATESSRIPVIRTTRDLLQYEGRFTASKDKVFLEGDKLYTTKDYKTAGDTLHVRGVLADPTLETGWSDKSSRYPLPEQLVDPLIKKILQVELNITLKTPVDEINDDLTKDKEPSNVIGKK